MRLTLKRFINLLSEKHLGVNATSLVLLTSNQSITCLLKHEMALSTDGTESVCGENAFTPLLFTPYFIVGNRRLP